MDWVPEAQPQTAEDARRSPACPEIVKAAKQRGVTGIVHFTRFPRGLVGILDSSAIKARRDLPGDARLKYVYEENAPDRSRDREWQGYVNLSVGTINVWMFRSSQKWHPTDDWVILEFDTAILGDPGVVFCTTNNAYPVVHRGRGLQGFEQMFAPRVPWGIHGSYHTRLHRSPRQTTDPQAEILYPSRVSLEHLRTIIVGQEDICDSAVSALSFYDDDPEVVINPEAFL